MRILNCMLSAEPAFKSVHLVLYNFLNVVAPDKYCNAFLRGDVDQQNTLMHAMSFNSKKKATKKVISVYFLRKKWLKKLYDFQPDIVVVDGPGMAKLLLPVLEKYNRAKVLVYFHGQTDFSARKISFFNQKYSFSLKLIAVSKTLTEQIKSKLPQLTVLTIPTYLDLPSIQHTPTYTRKNIVFGAVGRLVKAKNFCILIECIAQLINKDLKVILKIAGEGKYREELEGKIKQLGVNHYVTLTGKLENMESFYQSIDLLLVPSLQEGQGLVLQEAIHYKKPIICSDLPVFKEQLADSGVYCEVNDARQWSQACESYISKNTRQSLFERQHIQYQEYNTADLFRQRCIAACL